MAPFITLGDLRASRGNVEVECVACGHLAHRAAHEIAASDSTPVGSIGLTLTCSSCGAQACITGVAPPVAQPRP